MPDFTLFPRLHAGIRQMIWDVALLNETEERIIIVMENNSAGDEKRIAPLKKLASPILSVNCESRSRARVFYDAKIELRVFEVARLAGLTPSTGLAPDIQNIGEFLQPQVLREAVKLLRKAGRIGGTIYISTKYDHFVFLGYIRTYPGDQEYFDPVVAMNLFWSYNGSCPTSVITPRYIYAKLPPHIVEHIRILELIETKWGFVGCWTGDINTSVFHMVEVDNLRRLQHVKGVNTSWYQGFEFESRGLHDKLPATCFFDVLANQGWKYLADLHKFEPRVFSVKDCYHSEGFIWSDVYLGEEPIDQDGNPLASRWEIVEFLLSHHSR